MQHIVPIKIIFLTSIGIPKPVIGKMRLFSHLSPALKNIFCVNNEDYYYYNNIWFYLMLVASLNRLLETRFLKINLALKRNRIVVLLIFSVFD